MKKQKRNIWVEVARKTMMMAGVASILSLNACAGMKDRMSRIGVEPPLSKIENPYEKPGYKPVSMRCGSLRARHSSRTSARTRSAIF